MTGRHCSDRCVCETCFRPIPIVPDYHVYLASVAWHRKCEEAKARAGQRCQLCAAVEGLEVHHNEYKRLGREEPYDLVVLCAPCHRHHHGVEE